MRKQNTPAICRILHQELQIAGVLIIFILGLIVFAVAAISSLIGFCLGSSSIKYLPTKRMTIGAKIISFSNLILFVISIIGLLYFLKLFF